MKSREAFKREVSRNIPCFYTCIVKNYIGLVAATDTDNRLGANIGPIPIVLPIIGASLELLIRIFVNKICG